VWFGAFWAKKLVAFFAKNKELRITINNFLDYIAYTAFYMI
jgi:hypothetical protein